MPVTIYRCKGVVHSVEEPLRRSVLQVVGRRVDITPERAWDDGAARSRIVVIAARDGLDEESLKTRFDSCQRGIA